MAEAHRVKLSFAVPGPGGYMRIIHEGDWLKADDPLVRTHRDYLQAGDEYVEQMTAAPGEVRATKVPDKRRFGRRNQGDDMPHSLPPEHEDSPASAFAPFQPGAGVVADDKADSPEQNPGKGISAKDADKKYAGKEMPPVGDAVEGDAGAPVATDTDKSEGKPLKSTKG
jgi:hypothetical protein